MSFVHLYIRVLRLLGRESRLGWALAVANISLAAAQFAEPVLFGRIVDALSGAQSRAAAPAWTDLVSLLGAWVAFGLMSALLVLLGAGISRAGSALAAARRARFGTRRSGDG